MNISFIGLGLIGGSIAKTLKRKLPEHHLCAYDLDKDALSLALSEGTIDSTADQIDESFIKASDIIFLCAPVHSNTDFILTIKEHISESTILTDVGSVKCEINDIIEEVDLGYNFVGGHPMAGSEKSGYKNSTDRLFENAYYILTPSPKVSADKIDTMTDLVKSLDTIPLVLSPEHHDYATAAISHVPHVIAYSLVNLIKRSDDKNNTMKLIAAGGFKDITRIASSSPEMWRQICLVNKDNILNLMSDYIDTLVSIKELINNEESDKLYEYFDEAKEYRNSFIEASPGPIKKSYALYVDIKDESGAIAGLATTLADNSISIRNIGIIHNREFENGAIRIEFYFEKDYEKAADLLKSYNYTIYK